MPRRCTIRSKHFTEVLNISREDFFRLAKDDEESLVIFEAIKKKIRKKRNISSIGIVCYICGKMGHISLDCKQFPKVKGNINRHLK